MVFSELEYYWMEELASDLVTLSLLQISIFLIVHKWIGIGYYKWDPKKLRLQMFCG